MKPQDKFMRAAIAEAEKSQKEGDYAVGAVLVINNKIVARASNRSKRDESPIAHAETLAILEASQKFKSRHLKSAILYTTHEPCPMCAAVAVWARLRGVVYGARFDDMKKYRQKNGNKDYLWRTIDIPCKKIFDKSTEKIILVPDFLRTECQKLFHNS